VDVKVGVVSGTTRSCLPALRERLSDVDMIIHAGMVGGGVVLDELSRLAPVHAVVGHRDFLDLGDRLPETDVVDLPGGRIVVTHLVGEPPEFLPPVLRRLQEGQAPDVLVHGHPQTSSAIWVGGTLVFAPGHAKGGPRGRHGSVGVLEIEADQPITAHVYELQSEPEVAAPHPGQGSPANRS